jgi:uncharacterized circularly permuted ATP-grasp superfamily protein
MRSIDDRFDALVAGSPPEFMHDLDQLSNRLKGSHCLFGESVLPCFLKPHWISSKVANHIDNATSVFMNMLEKIVEAYFFHPDMHGIFGLSKADEEFVRMDTGLKRNIWISRPDGFLSKDSFRFIEFNCDSPAGAGYADHQEGIFRKSFPLKKLSRMYRWNRPRRMEMLLRALLLAYREFKGGYRTPHIAIVDWKGLKTAHEFLIFKQYFESQGYPTVVADPRDLRLKSGHLYFKNFRVDLVYRRVIFGELMKKKSEARDFLRAYAKGKVCVVNPLRARLAANKSVISVLTNPSYNYFFTPKERQVRDMHLPWTRRVIDAIKSYRGQQIDLKHFIERNQKKLVLKPSDGYGGRDVKMGKETSVAEWRRTMNRAILDGEHWVVQEFVSIPTMRVPIVSKGKILLKNKKVNINPFVFGGHFAGAISRLSDASVINVSAGGGLIPVMIYERHKRGN